MGQRSEVARKRPAPRWLEAARQRTQERGDGSWLSRALSRAGVLPLAVAEKAIRDGRVKVGGAVVTEPFAPVDPSSSVRVDGAEVSLAWHTRVLAFHKTAGLVTHGSDPEGIGTVFEALARVLPAELQGYGWHAVGRLDRDTTGLLLFTNDERFVAHATNPATHLPKRYRATVGAPVTEPGLAALRRGVDLDDGPTRPAEARQLGATAVELVLTEGRFHQVKRMLQAVGWPTLTLHREAVGALGCDVGPGEVREVTSLELSTLLGYTAR